MTAPIRSGRTDLSDDDYEPVLYTQSELDAAGARVGVIVSIVWAVICTIVVVLSLTGGH